ncbi:hypothetical protein MNL76_06065 [Fervidobacterium riparium]|uniref:Uncharacterized protein n=1 Tax=Fervidobacterium gondwanense DSM 13020 TaxID=1121883 RepID=A0A1M7TG69_FERGO|nr:hypothetical protein [Fervidobacterium gondwanense]UXF00253.1 hypothetical protein IB67_01255 [Fervidobacterium riparium]SHN69706.1 hypothetical protein SAMN02745226_01959 [Fervidobacterium gondwanense DSM 13020]
MKKGKKVFTEKLYVSCSDMHFCLKFNVFFGKYGELFVFEDSKVVEHIATPVVVSVVSKSLCNVCPEYGCFVSLRSFDISGKSTKLSIRVWDLRSNKVVCVFEADGEKVANVEPAILDGLSRVILDSALYLVNMYYQKYYGLELKKIELGDFVNVKLSLFI